MLEATNAGPRIVEHHEELVKLANSLDEKMGSLLKEHEKDFFLAYKTHMYTVQKEIKSLRLKAEAQEAKTREDAKIKALEGELDWFMTEALRLDELCKGYKKEVDKWKSKALALDEDRRFLEDQIKGAKRQNKILRAAAERARSSAYSALLATKAKTENLKTLLPALNDGAIPMGEVGKRPSSASRALASSSGGKGVHVRSKTPDALKVSTLPGSTAGSSGFAAARAPSAMRGSPTPDSGMSAGPNVLGSDAERRYLEAIAHLKESIVREQQTVRMLQAARATQYTRKSEMEEFFLKCVDESRKELIRRRHLTLYKEKTDRERVMEAMLTNEEILVSLYEKLFPHRTGIARSLGTIGGGIEAADDGGLEAL